ncbi:hypothetical protein [Brevibacillus parabrevis]|uniref:hypothetical protein n=1 Tax=Brevibacillus parabrevis TaxID=54914 RepID=UPI002E1E83A2|nr:hypothetical protein [Brevibacillus parabrevis]
MRQIPLDEEKLEDYIPALIEALIPLGDKIYFLTHDATLYYSEEIIAAEHKLKEPVCHAIRLLQEKGAVRQDMSVDWVWNALYMLVFIAWQQVQRWAIWRKSTARSTVLRFPASLL